ncbi:hypothetical protein FIC_02383 [Flavobacteriaceae bacterium 3519-10]|nr:hypothetical protein FIC_02383 [Flavobacteriaceae bacterium 3519-10]
MLFFGSLTPKSDVILAKSGSDFERNVSILNINYVVKSNYK